MKERIARRFLTRNAWKIVTGNGSPSFFRMVEKCKKVIRDNSYKRMTVEERLFNMSNHSEI